MALDDITFDYLSAASAEGDAIKVAATSTPGTLLHTAGASGVEVLTLYAVNTSSTTVTLTLEWGGTTSPDDLVPQDIRPNVGPVKLCMNRPLAAGASLRAFAGTTNVLTVYGEMNKVLPS